jgi:hypothetical protein
LSLVSLAALVVTWGMIEEIKSFVLIKFKAFEKNAVAVREEIRQRLELIFSSD